MPSEYSFFTTFFMNLKLNLRGKYSWYGLLLFYWSSNSERYYLYHNWFYNWHRHTNIICISVLYKKSLKLLKFLPLKYHGTGHNQRKQNSFFHSTETLFWCPLTWNQIGVIIFFDLFLSYSLFFLTIYLFQIYISRLSLCMTIILSNLVCWNGHFLFLTYRPSLGTRTQDSKSVFLCHVFPGIHQLITHFLFLRKDQLM